jgi:ketosteroid isomerase-like protein
MSQDNVESLRAFLETWSRRAWRTEQGRRWEPDLSLLDPDFIFEDTVLPDQVGESYRGHEGFIRAGENWAGAYEWLLVELEQIIGAGDRIVSIHRARSKARHTGIESESPFAYVWTFQDDKIIHCRGFASPRKALEAAGLRE